MTELPKFNREYAQLAELTFDRARFEAGSAALRKKLDDADAQRRSKGCRDRNGAPLVRPVGYLLCDAESVKTQVWGRWLRLFTEAHEDHRKRCVRCGNVGRE